MKFFKKNIALIAILSLLSTNIALAEFTDLGQDHVYYTEITDLNEQGCLNGYPDGSIKPDQLINRVETLKLIITCLELPGIYQEETFVLPEGSTYTVDDQETKVSARTTVKLKVPIDFTKQSALEFTDVDDLSWYAPFLKEAILRDLVNGYSDGTIKPTKTITKAEFFTILYRLVPKEFKNDPLPAEIASDVPTDSWFADGMHFGIENKLINLNENAETNSQIELNRGHIAFFLYNYSEWLDNKLNPSSEAENDSNENQEENDNSAETEEENSTNETPSETEEDESTNEPTDEDSSTEETTDDTSETSPETDTTTNISSDPAQFVIGYSETGQASYYGENFTGHTTASGDLHNPTELVAAHKTIPFNTIIKVTNLDTGLWVKVRINDRGPYVEGRVIDLSYSAFDAIASPSAGLANVQIEIVE